MSFLNRLLIAFFCLVIMTASGTAHAKPKPWIWSWWPEHWENQDFNPYLKGAPHMHTSQWDNEDWTPEEWIKRANGNELAALQRYYKAGILKDQYMDGDMPVLVVGDKFFRLGGYDKQRVMALVDHIYEITDNGTGDGVFKICDGKKEVGMYTKYGAHYL